MSSRRHLVIEITAGRLCAVETVLAGGDLRIERALRTQLPADLEQDAAATGKWLRQILTENHMKCRDATIALARSSVIVKQLSFPAGVDRSNELPGMVRLQMVRQLALPAEGAAIDYVEVGRPGPDEPQQGEALLHVLAAAVTADRMQWVRETTRAAGLKLSRVALKASGAAAMLAERAQQNLADALAVIFDGGGCEFLVLANGQLIFSRHADLGGAIDSAAGQSLEAMLSAVETEAKRSWASYRMRSASVQVESVFIVGDGPWAEAACARIGAALEMPALAVGGGARLFAADFHIEDKLAAEESHRGAAVHWVAPLAGVLLERVVGRELLNLARERKAPDRRAGLRKAALAAVLLMLLVLGIAYTLLSRRLAAAEDELAMLEKRRQEVGMRQLQARQTTARLDYLERWSALAPQWLDHFAAVQQALPPAEQAMLTGFVGRADLGVVYGARGGAAYDPQQWQSGGVVTITLDGVAVGADAAAAARGQLVADRRYRVQPLGRDAISGKNQRYPFPFSMQLQTALLDPATADDQAAAAGAGDAQ